MAVPSSLTQLKWWKTFCSPDRFSYAQMPDLTGKIAIVTGANTGLGYATTVALAGCGARVFLACRNKQKAMDAIENAKKDIQEKYPQLIGEPKLEFLELDLNSLAKSRDAAKSFLAKNLPLHILVCNSGIMMTPFELSADGIETQFAVNHMGHFVFTTELLPKIKESQPSRIVVLTSMAHESTVSGGIDFDTLNDATKSNPISRYGRSKLANVLFARALAHRVAKEKVYVNIAHPGYASTELIRHSKDMGGAVYGKIMECVTRTVAMDPERSALTQLYLASSPEIEEQNIRGRYFIPIANEIEPSAYARDEELQEKLWIFSEKLYKEKLGSAV
ncbi:hypothetical protein BGZ99_000943 [Dissophora globulifera]|uniref:NAD(P)-binding protein n=1 Tax=Dissophora globulifera TaxID=979702 RepID=A0A9P6UYA9_9FUNG|nr:hypothetical protein BGZ99_000943 [Dissophora globulifera]